MNFGQEEGLRQRWRKGWGLEDQGPALAWEGLAGSPALPRAFFSWSFYCFKPPSLPAR